MLRCASNLYDSESESGQAMRFTMVCLSYRGYWTSCGRPSEKGINQDALAAIKWIADRRVGESGATSSGSQNRVILWGQSIGSGILTNLAAHAATHGSCVTLNGIILETPFLSIRAMMEHLYPERWVPYKHLWPFLRNRLDSCENMATIAGASQDRRPSRILILQAGKDELVPPEHGMKLTEQCIRLGLPVVNRTVKGAYHNEASLRDEGKYAIARYIIEQGADKRGDEGQDKTDTTLGERKK